MQLSRMASTLLRPTQYEEDSNAFRARCGSVLTGTYFCSVPMGTRVLYDASTHELVTVEGIVIEDQPHLSNELDALCAAVAQMIGEAPTAVEGVLLRDKQGTGYVQILDLHHNTLTVWRQINLLADIHSQMERNIPHIRPAQHSPSSALRSDGQFKRWLMAWKKPGIHGLLVKTAECLPGKPEALSDCCFISFR